MPLLLKKIAEEYKNQLDSNPSLQPEKKYILIYKLLSRLIVKVEIPASTLLPPTRKLAETLKVSRSTILRVYDILVLDGLILPTQGSGYVVKPMESLVQPKTQSKPNTYPSYSKIGKSFLKLGPNLVANSGQEVAFSPGLPPLDIFPVAQWKNLSNMYWKEIKFSNLAYSPSSGIDRLKINLSNYLKLTRNLHCDPRQVIIVSGSLQSIYLLGSLFINPGEKVILENPTFPNVKAIFSGLMANLIPTPVDAEGIQIEHLKSEKASAKLIHVTPSCHYPLGTKMSMARRLALLEYAAENKSIVIENDYEHELNNAQQALPPIYCLDQEQRTIYLGTFNRMLHPSIRIGYMVVPTQFIEPLEILLKHSHRFVAPSIQFVLNQFMEKKYLHQHVANLINTVEQRASYFRQTFDSIFNETGLSMAAQNTLSLQSLVNINNSWSEKELLALLAQHHISAHSLSNCFLTQNASSGLIMGHSSIPKPMLKNKLQRMHQLLEMKA